MSSSISILTLSADKPSLGAINVGRAIDGKTIVGGMHLSRGG
jgi:hypothetical protein